MSGEMFKAVCKFGLEGIVSKNPKGTCNLQGVDGGGAKDMAANCSAKNCSGSGSSAQKQKKN